MRSMVLSLRHLIVCLRHAQSYEALGLVMWVTKGLWLLYDQAITTILGGSLAIFIEAPKLEMFTILRETLHNIVR